MGLVVTRLVVAGGAALVGAALLRGAAPAVDGPAGDGAPAAAAVPAGGEEGAPVTVPFRLLPSNHIVIEAKLNGTGPYRFIFDLGAPVTLLDGKTAEASGAIDKGAPRAFLLGSRGEGKVASFEMGELKASDVPVVVMDHPVVKALGGMLGRPLVGIVGYTFWAHYKMTIDYQAKQMTFVPVAFEVRDLMKELPARLSGPKRSVEVVLAPRGLWGFGVGEPAEGGAGVNAGVPVTAVVAGGPAEAGGLKVGDVVASIDGRWTTSVADAYAAAQAVAPTGAPVAVVVVRDGQERTLSITPAEGL